MLKQAATIEDYNRIFEIERAQTYPAVDAFEQRMWYVLDKTRLECAAYVLACPVKRNPPNWQHGRVLYSIARWHLREQYMSVWVYSGIESITMLDIGTAKGFSALCLQWAFDDGTSGWEDIPNSCVYSVDVINPQARVPRNSVGDREGVLTLSELLTAWPESQRIQFEHSTGIDWLKRHPERIHVAFVDGKHESAVVLTEGKLLADRQEPGDVVMFDDVQIPGVAKAVAQMDMYDLEYLAIKPEREYAIGVRK